MSDSLYEPAEAAILVQPWSEAFRGQRDVGLRVPINFNTAVPAVSLRAACFAHNQFGHEPFGKCFSNLLSIGFKRFLVDVYWDPGRAVWSLCPAEVPSAIVNEQEEQDTPSAVTVPTNAPSVTEQAIDQIEETSLPTLSSTEQRVQPRQDTSRSSSSTSASSPTLPADVSTSRNNGDVLPGATVSPSPLPVPSNYAEPMIQIGNTYNCSSLMTLSYVANILADFLDATSTTVDASVTYLILNIHAAAPFSDPTAPAQKPPVDQLPQNDQLINQVLKGNLSDDMYAFDQLQSQRSNLDSSWYDVARDLKPATGYYQTEINAEGHPTTSNGWPTEAYIEFGKYLRVLVGLGTVDPQMSDYPYSEDLGIVFPLGEIRSLRETTTSADGLVTSGCLFAPAEDSVTAATNSSWAVAVAPPLNIGSNPDPTVSIPSITNLTACGLMPFLNTSLGGATADQNIIPYMAYTYSTLWSWAPGQPLNTTSDSNNHENKCVAVHPSPPYPGRWYTVDCQSRHHFACQHPDNPYHWEISSGTNTYFEGDSACPAPLIFAVPRTALENAHLRSTIEGSTNAPDEPIFLNFNSIDIKDCWAWGINATCPYQPRTDVNKTRVVVVPTVAAVIIFVLAALTFFVKCAANRTEDKRGRRRRNVGGWDYEGVPS